MKLLKATCVRNGMSIKQLAERMGVSRQTIHNWDTKLIVPSIHDINALANILELDLLELVKYFLEEE